MFSHHRNLTEGYDLLTLSRLPERPLKSCQSETRSSVLIRMTKAALVILLCKYEHSYGYAWNAYIGRLVAG